MISIINSNEKFFAKKPKHYILLKCLAKNTLNILYSPITNTSQNPTNHLKIRNLVYIKTSAMKTLRFIILLLLLQSCATKKYTTIHQLPNGIHSTTEEKYVVENNRKELIQTKKMTFTKNGRIKNSQTTDSSGKVIQETKKKLWFIVETYPDREPYYCKTRWKPNQRERISCYTQKQHKENEAIYHYNPNGTIAKIVDNYSSFETQYYYYENNRLSKIVIKDKNNKPLDEVVIECKSQDEKGSCLKEFRKSTSTNRIEEINFKPIYF